MEKVKPIYRNLLIAAIALFVIGTAVALSDIYGKIGAIEHSMVHGTSICTHGLKDAR